MTTVFRADELDLAPGKLPPRRYAWTVFAIVFALMVVDYVDRQVVVSMFSHLKRQWDLSDRQLGALVSIVSVTVALGAVPLSLLADRWSRVKSIFLMALVWSLATIGCAFATSYSQLLGARALVGVGEAAYGTVGAALLASLFPARMRSTVIGAFLAAGMLGSVVGVVVGGFIAERWGWQAGFGAVGLPGLVLAFVFLMVVRDYGTVPLPASGDASSSRHAARVVLTELVRPRTAIVTCVGAGLSLLVVSTMWSWLPSYFSRYYGVAPDRAGLMTGGIVLIGGLSALLWSVVADRLSSRYRCARLYVPAVTALLTAACMTAAFAFVAPGPAQLVVIATGALLMLGSVGPADAVVIDVIHPSVRATAVSVLSLTRNLFGLAGGPLLAGALSDAYGLDVALSIVPLVGIGAAAFLLLAARTYERDLDDAAAPRPEPAPALKPQPA